MPLRLRFLSGSLRGRELDFGGPEVRVGRSRDNDLVLPDDDSLPVSSAHHAKLVHDGTGWLVEDLGSTNGTLLNGRSVARERLRDGDELSFGDIVSRVELASGEGSRSRGLVLAVATVASALFVVLVVFQRVALAPKDALASAARAVEPSIYLVLVGRGEEQRPIATAFAVRDSGSLVTCAHVIDELQKRGALPLRSEAPARVTTIDGAEILGVERVWVHSDYRPGSFGGDVALLILEQPGPSRPLPLADATHLARLRAGVSLATVGFVAQDAEENLWKTDYRRGLLHGVHSRRYLEVGLPVTSGMSGSPLFDEEGVVVGVVVGHRSASPARDEALSWAVSAAAVHELLAEVEASSLQRARERPSRQ